MSDSSSFAPPPTFLNRTIWTVGITLAMLTTLVIIGAVLVRAADLVFLLFTAVILGVFLQRIARMLAEWARWPFPVSLSVTVLGLIALFGGMFALFGYQVEEQINQFSPKFEEGIGRLREEIADRPGVQSAVARVPLLGDYLTKSPETGLPIDATTTPGDPPVEPDTPAKDTIDTVADVVEQSIALDSPDEERAGEPGDRSPTGVAARTPGTTALSTAVTAVQTLFATTFGAVLNVFIVSVVGIYFAAEGRAFYEGLVRIAPKGRRERTAEILSAVERTLFRWLIGRLITMTITGVLTGVSMWLLGVPLALTVGIITGLLTFIPNIGALICLILAAALALTVGPWTTVAVVVIYLIEQFIEGYFITPMIESHQVNTSGALLIVMQALMGVLFGFLGIMVATPILAVLTTLFKEVYLHDVVGDSSVDADTDISELPPAVVAPADGALDPAKVF